MLSTNRFEMIPIWPDEIPGSENDVRAEQETLFPAFIGPEQTRVIRNVTRPTLLAYLPDPEIANGTGVVVCPGGAFAFLAIESEGTEVAHWLNQRGVAVFVLKYRLTPTPTRDEDFLQQLMQIVHDEKQMKAQVPIAIMDGQQALKVVRARASEWNLNPARIGILGFSGGGVIALATATQYEADKWPDFVAPIYAPVWQELKVPADAPPLFSALASDDPAVPDGNMALYKAWKTAGRPVELHSYSKGGHAFGMIKQGLPSDSWIERFGEWLQVQGFL